MGGNSIVMHSQVAIYKPGASCWPANLTPLEAFHLLGSISHQLVALKVIQLPSCLLIEHLKNLNKMGGIREVRQRVISHSEIHPMESSAYDDDNECVGIRGSPSQNLAYELFDPKAPRQSLVNNGGGDLSQRLCINKADDPNVPFRLAVRQQDQFQQGGYIYYLNNAIFNYRTALDVSSESHPNRPTVLRNLAKCLELRFERHGDPQDLIDAIDKYTTVVHLLPQAHPLQASCRSELGTLLITRFDLQQNPEDLDQSVGFHRDAVQLRPSGHPDRVLSLDNLATSLVKRYQQRYDPQDLNEAIIHYRNILTLLEVGHPDRATYYQKLQAATTTGIQANIQNWGIYEMQDDVAPRRRRVPVLSPSVRIPGHRKRRRQILGRRKAVMRQSAKKRQATVHPRNTIERDRREVARTQDDISEPVLSHRGRHRQLFRVENPHYIPAINSDRTANIITNYTCHIPLERFRFIAGTGTRWSIPSRLPLDITPVGINILPYPFHFHGSSPDDLTSLARISPLPLLDSFRGLTSSAQFLYRCRSNNLFGRWNPRSLRRELATFLQTWFGRQVLCRGILERGDCVYKNGVALVGLYWSTWATHQRVLDFRMIASRDAYSPLHT